MSKPEPRLKTLGFRVSTLDKSHIKTLETRPQAVRIRGTALQEKRKRWWQNNPHCESCGKFTIYPSGFQLDHVIRLADGGDESDENTQLLCIDCHDSKTKSEN